MPPRKKIKVIENAWIARLAARKLGFNYVAIVIGRTIYLHNAPASHFLASKRWVLHELKHVEQFEREGFIWFLVSYLIEYFRSGYYQNRYEIEARAAENDSSLLLKYETIINIS